jgi:hypothetical protein
MRRLHIPDRLWVDQPTISQWRVHEIVLRSPTLVNRMYNAHVATRRRATPGLRAPGNAPVCFGSSSHIRPGASQRPTSGIDAPVCPRSVANARAVPSTCASSALRPHYLRIWIGLRLNHVFVQVVPPTWHARSRARSDPLPPFRPFAGRDRAPRDIPHETGKRRPSFTRYRLRRPIIAERCVASIVDDSAPEAFSPQTTFLLRSDGLPSPARVAPAHANYNLTRQYEHSVHRRGTPRVAACPPFWQTR